MTHNKTYTVKDILNAGCMLEPLKCIHCGHIGEVIYSDHVKDGRCQVCGVWQISKKRD